MKGDNKMESFTVAEIRAIANWCNDWLKKEQTIMLKEGFEDKYIMYDDENGKREVVKVSDIMSDLYALEWARGNPRFFFL